MDDSASPFRVILGSSSAARHATLRHAGIDAVICSPDVDESYDPSLSAVEVTADLAHRKAQSVLARLGDRVEKPFVLICCDSLLEIDGKLYGKPGSEEAAIIRWHRMRKHQGVLVTGHWVAVVDSSGHMRSQCRSAETVVTFADLTDTEIRAYVSTGEPQRVAGGFTIDSFGGPFITRISGDPHNVVGISLPLVRQMLLDLGVEWHRLWTIRREDLHTERRIVQIC